MYYHGSGKLFAEFDKEKVGKNFRDSEDGGFFFTQKRLSAESYAYLATGGERPGFVYEAELIMNNPLTASTNSDYYPPADYYDLHSSDLLREVFLGGHDSILINGTRGDDLAVVFEPSQVHVQRITQENGPFEPAPAAPLKVVAPPVEHEEAEPVKTVSMSRRLRR